MAEVSKKKAAAGLENWEPKAAPMAVVPSNGKQLGRPRTNAVKPKPDESAEPEENEADYQPVSFRLDKDVHFALKTQALHGRTTCAKIIREGINLYFEKYGLPVPGRVS